MVPITGKELFYILFVSIGLIFFAQYGNQKWALAIAGLILVSSLVMNIDKVKGVFA